MRFSLFELLTGRPAGTTYRRISTRDLQDLFDAAADYTLRELAFDACIDMVANALGRCDFRTYEAGVETAGPEHWLWNFEPNPNQNSTVFLHKLVDHLYRHNETLIISERRRGTDLEVLAVADEWDQGDQQIVRQNEYRKVRVEDLHFAKTFREPDVIHLRLHQKAIEPVIRRLDASWERMATLAQKHYEWDRGQHWKVHVSQVASGQDGFDANFAQMLQEQVKPFLDNPNAVLPEFDGYDYKREGSSSGSAGSSSDVRDLAEDIFNFTARGFLIPAVLVNGRVEATADANNRFLTYVIDPLCDQLQEEITRKRYGYDSWRRGNYLRVDSSSILHYDLFGQAASIEKLIGSGYSINEVRHAAGQAEIHAPWADEHYLTKNIGTFADALAAPEP